MSYKVDLSFLDDLESEIVEIAVKDLEIDPKLQRPLDKNRVNAMFKEFTPSGIGTLAVSRRVRPTETIVIDGQHRLEVLRLKLPEGGPEVVRCEAFKNLTPKQEALLFLVLNRSAKVRAVDQFRLAVEAGEPTAVKVKELIDSYGFELATYPRTGNIQCVDVLRRVYEKSEKKDQMPNVLQLVLLTVEKAWRGQKGGVAGIMVTALAAIFDEYGDKLNVTEFIERLRDHKPMDLIFQGNQFAGYKKIKPAMGLAEVLVGVYNVDERGHRRQGNKRLWDWRRRA
jgi:hypothetical protein